MVEGSPKPLSFTWFHPGAGLKHFENSEVFPAGSVAVAVTNAPGGSKTGRVAAKCARPATFVLTVAEPRNTCPSPEADGSQLSLLKNSSRNVVCGVLVSKPCILTADSIRATAVMTGKFCRSFGPAS